jgi:hypothetical protein
MMRSPYRYGLVLSLLLGGTGIGVAQTPATCTTIIAPAGALAAWTTPVERAAVGDASHLANSEIAVSQALHLALLPQGAVKFPMTPGKPGMEGGHAGLLSLTITTPGTYRVALGTGAWIDLVDHAQPVASIAHTRGPACSGIRKMVDFTLHPGNYTLQISANAESQTTVLVTQVP